MILVFLTLGSLMAYVCYETVTLALKEGPFGTELMGFGWFIAGMFLAVGSFTLVVLGAIGIVGVLLGDI